MRYEVRYVGAPYGDNESGELVSWHRTRQAAEHAMGLLYRCPKYYGNLRVREVGVTRPQKGKAARP